jgi:alpha-N-acetylglucosaminidase
MVEAAPACDTNAFRYDLVDIAREWLSYGACLERLDAINVSAPSATLEATVGAFLEVTDDIDTMLQTNKGFLLGAWLNGSRSVAQWDGSGGKLASFYEWNGRVQVTTWAGRYSRREWSGMIKGYYQERTRIWLKATLQTPPPDINKLLDDFDLEWQHRTWTSAEAPASAVGDPVATARAMLTKYS